MKIAICLTTFLRDNLLYKTIQTIVDNFPQDCILLIADQGYDSLDKRTNIDYIKSLIPCEYYRLTFDCGLSYARNFLVNKANEMQIPYCLIIPDSIQFEKVYNFEQLSIVLDINTLISFGITPFKDVFIAKTNTLLNLWDEELKTYEHELAYTNYMKRGYKVVYNTNFIFKKVKSRSNKEYQTYSERIKEYQKLSKLKSKNLL